MSLFETHRWKAPGVFLPKETALPCGAQLGEDVCELAEGHDGRHIRGEHPDGVPLFFFPEFEAEYDAGRAAHPGYVSKHDPRLKPGGELDATP